MGVVKRMAREKSLLGDTLYITGAGVSSESGIPTFRGEDGYWTIGSRNYTPQEMATRAMYEENPAQFLLWYYKRFATYRHHGPNAVHTWLADKNLITQNIDGLDGKAGNKDYIAIHGRLDLMTLYHEQGEDVALLQAPWANLDGGASDAELAEALLGVFRIDSRSKRPILYQSFKPFVLLFDEYYTDLYRMGEAQARMQAAERMVFMGTSFSVNITLIALRIASLRKIPVEVVDPNPVDLPYKKVTYHRMTALEYIQEVSRD